jgi:septum formation protein
MTSPSLNHAFILASTSATRRSLLENAGVSFASMSPLCDEEIEKRDFKGDKTKDLALHLAKTKALSLSNQQADALVLGADQTLIFEGEIYSKAKNIEAARKVLLQLRGKTHVLQSALAIAHSTDIIWSDVKEARLTMRDISDSFIDDYLAREGPQLLSSVGCYQIEKRGLQLFDDIDGDHATILGLPLLGLLRFLREKGMLAT